MDCLEVEGGRWSPEEGKRKSGQCPHDSSSSVTCLSVERASEVRVVREGGCGVGPSLRFPLLHLLQ